jgi:hypothetical protein
MTTIPTMFKALDIECGADLERYCMTDPNKKTITKYHGEGIASLYQKALGSISGQMVKETIPGMLDVEDRLVAARFNLYLVGLITVDGGKIGLADFLRAADSAPAEILALGTELWEKSGLHEVTQRAGVMDGSVSEEDYRKNLLELLEAGEAYPE